MFVTKIVDVTNRANVIFDDSATPIDLLSKVELQSAITKLQNYSNWWTGAQKKVTENTKKSRAADNTSNAAGANAIITLLQKRLSTLNAATVVASDRSKELVSQGLTPESANAQAAKEVADALAEKEKDAIPKPLQPYTAPDGFEWKWEETGDKSRSGWILVRIIEPIPTVGTSVPVKSNTGLIVAIVGLGIIVIGGIVYIIKRK